MSPWLGRLELNFATGISGPMRHSKGFSDMLVCHHWYIFHLCLPQVPATQVFRRPMHPGTPCPVCSTLSKQRNFQLFLTYTLRCLCADQKELALEEVFIVQPRTYQIYHEFCFKCYNYTRHSIKGLSWFGC